MCHTAKIGSKEEVSSSVIWHLALHHVANTMTISEKVQASTLSCTTATGCTMRSVWELVRRVPFELDETAKHEKSNNAKNPTFG